MAKPTRTPAQRDHDRSETARLYLRGWPQWKIAEKLGVVKQQICYDLKKIRQHWRESSIIDFNEAKARELDKLDELERTYWDGWERSVGVHEKSRTGRKEGKDGEPQTYAQIEREELVGDASFLAGVMSCIKKRCEILGLDAPTREEHAGPGGGPIPFESVGPLDEMTEDDIHRAVAYAEWLVQKRNHG